MPEKKSRNEIKHADLNFFSGSLLTLTTFLILIAVSIIIANLIISPLVNFQSSRPALLIIIFCLILLLSFSFHVYFELKLLKKIEPAENKKHAIGYKLLGAIWVVCVKIFYRTARVFFYLIMFSVIIILISLAIYVNSLF